MCLISSVCWTPLKKGSRRTEARWIEARGTEARGTEARGIEPT